MEERIETIVLLCCLHFDVKPQELFSKSHTRNSVYARAACVFLIRKYTTKVYREIAKMFNRSYPTVITNTNNMVQIIFEEIDIIESKYKRIAA